MHKKRSHSKRTAAVFLITLGGVILLGLIAIGIMRLVQGRTSAANKEYAGASSDSDDFLKKETIPETASSFSDTSGNNDSASADALLDEEVLSRYGGILSSAERMEEERIYTREAASEDVITLAFTGDILFDDEYSMMASLINRGGELNTSMGQSLLDLMNSVDIMVVNNEFPYTERGTKTENKDYNFRADLDTVKYLDDMGADVAILANNHVLDYGQEGLNDTLDVLKENGIASVGAGRNIEEASHPIYFIVNDTKIAIVAATQIERLDNPPTVSATENSGGTFRCWTGDLIYEKIREAKENADFVIVCVHWGTEKETSPDSYQLAQGPKMAEAGADVIIGDHPHVLQGITYFGDTPCIYSLGNFWFNSSTIDTGIVELEIADNELKSFRFIPCLQSGNVTRLTEGEDSERILNSMREMSSGVTIDDNGYVYKK